MTMRRAVGVSTALLTVALLSGCSDSEVGSAAPIGEDGNSQPTSSPAGPSSGANADNQVPKVDEPLDVTNLEQDPCGVLTDQQIQKLNLLAGTNEPMDTGAARCTFRYDDDTGSRVSFIQDPAFSNGLADVYDRESNLAYFEPTQVSGYPGVYTRPYKDDRSAGYCTLQLGLTGQDVISVMVYLGRNSSDFPRGCEVAELSAQNMIENLKGGA